MARRYVRFRRRLVELAIVGGVNPYMVRSLRYIPLFMRQLRDYKRQAQGGRFPYNPAYLRPVLADYDGPAGVARGHYFHQDLWAARRIFAARPSTHVDVGSRIDGFVAHLLTFMPVTVVDVRPLEDRVEGLTFVQGDACNLGAFTSRSVESLSSLHTVEHVGLGRYRDPVDPEGCFRAIHELSRVLRPGGRLYFSVPIGKERVQFNSQRIFAPRTILEAFSDLHVLRFDAVDDAGEFHETARPDDFTKADDSCGLFEFTKP